MTKSTPTLTQSGLLAVLLQRQRYAVIELARRHAHRQHLRAAFWKTLTWPFRALTARTFANYTGRRQQIHSDLTSADSGLQVNLEIALSGVSAKVKPPDRLSAGPKVR